MSDKDKPRTKEQLIQSISKTLSERREKRSTSLDQVSQSLKIRKHFLESLESGQWSELPGEVYVRGFIRRYAQFLGLDGAALLAPYIDACQADEGEQDQEETAGDPIEKKKMNFIWIGVGAFVLFGVINFIRHHQSTLNLEVDSSENIPISTPSPEPMAEPLATAPSTTNEHEIVVFSPLPLWLRVQAENRTFEGFIPQQSTWVWKGEGQFMVRLGHTRQVLVHFDGAPVPLKENRKRFELPVAYATSQ